MNELVERHNTMLALLEDQPYKTCIKDIDVIIEKDVFPSDRGYTTEALIEAIENTDGETALDMGCGCGILSIAMQRQGYKKIFAIDRHMPAFMCTKKNIKLHNLNNYITPLYGDLFLPITNTNIIFDLIVFNYPYFPTVGHPVFGNDPDGGREILIRFLSAAKNYINKESNLLLPYSDICGSNSNPAYIASNLNYISKELIRFKYDGQNHKIYKLSLKD